MGIQADNANLGLAALAYAAVRLVKDAIPLDSELLLFSPNSAATLDRMRAELGLGDLPLRTRALRLKDPLGLASAFKEMSQCDLVVDFTGGDSFSDIYGQKRLARKLFYKQMVLWAGTPLVLAPQTYGPLTRRLSIPWFRHVVDRASQVYSRDNLSADFLRSLIRRDVRVTTDVAVTLPWDETMYSFPINGTLRVAISVSGLLWRGGYTGQNQFDLRADYRQYCHELVDALISRGWEVHLVAHVAGRPSEDIDEDDVHACRELAKDHPAVRLGPAFESPVQAKSYIAKMDLLVGSRMHATIASFSSGVATIPVAYSRKFIGFFGNLDYHRVVDLTTSGTAEAVARTLDFVEKRDDLRAETRAGRELAKNRVRVFSDGLHDLVQLMGQVPG